MRAGGTWTPSKIVKTCVHWCLAASGSQALGMCKVTSVGCSLDRRGKPPPDHPPCEDGEWVGLIVKPVCYDPDRSTGPIATVGCHSGGASAPRASEVMSAVCLMERRGTPTSNQVGVGKVDLRALCHVVDESTGPIATGGCHSGGASAPRASEVMSRVCPVDRRGIPTSNQVGVGRVCRGALRHDPNESTGPIATRGLPQRRGISPESV